MTSVALIVLNWNTAAEVVALVRAMMESQGFNAGLSFIIVDNASSVEDRLQLRAIEDRAKIFYLEENLGYAGGNNIGIKYALAEGYHHIGLVNSDIAINANQIFGFIHAFIQESKADIGGPGIIEGDHQYAGGKNIALHLNTRRNNPNDSAEEWINVEYIPGTFIIVDSQVFLKIGLLDEDYFFSGEIADFCFRAFSEDFGILVNTCFSINHQINNSEERRGSMYLYYNLRNRFLFVSKFYPGLKTIWIFRGLRFAFGALCRLKIKRFRAASLATLHGLQGKYGNSNYLFIK